MDLTETRRNVTGQVCKKYGKITHFDLKSSQPVENRKRTPHQKFQGAPPPGLSPHLT